MERSRREDGIQNPPRDGEGDQPQAGGGGSEPPTDPPPPPFRRSPSPFRGGQLMLDLPSHRDEAWRWSDLSALPDIVAREQRGAVPEALPWIDCAREGPHLLFVDGKLAAGKSNLGGIDIGAISVDADDHALARLAGTRGWKLKLGHDHAPHGLVQIVHVSTGGGGPSRGRDRTGCRCAGVGGRDLHRRRLGEPADWHHPLQRCPADAGTAAARRQRLRQPYRPSKCRRRREPCRHHACGRRRGHSARRHDPPRRAKALMPRRAARCSAAGGSGTTPISPSGTTCPAERAGRSGARSPTTRRYARSRHGSRWRAMRRRPMASSR